MVLRLSTRLLPISYFKISPGLKGKIYTFIGYRKAANSKAMQDHTTVHVIWSKFALVGTHIYIYIYSSFWFVQSHSGTSHVTMVMPVFPEGYVAKACGNYGKYMYGHEGNHSPFNGDVGWLMTKSENKFLPERIYIRYMELNSRSNWCTANGWRWCDRQGAARSHKVEFGRTDLCQAEGRAGASRRLTCKLSRTKRIRALPAP